MKFTEKFVTAPVEILANDHYVAVTANLASYSSLAVEGVIKAGTVVPSNDADAMGVVLYDVKLAENPNGAVVIHGFIKESKIAAVDPTAKAALKQISFIPEI